MRAADKIAIGFAGVLCALWFGIFFIGALAMSTGLADTPGNTNGLKRFLFWFALGSPGLIGMILCGLALVRARPRDPTGGRRGFAVIDDDAANDQATDRVIEPPETIDNWRIKSHGVSDHRDP